MHQIPWKYTRNMTHDCHLLQVGGCLRQLIVNLDVDGVLTVTRKVDL